MAVGRIQGFHSHRGMGWDGCVSFNLFIYLLYIFYMFIIYIYICLSIWNLIINGCCDMCYRRDINVC